jgi:excisionase family DNA binding protein
MARYLNVSLKTIYRLVEGRAIPFYKIGRGLRFKREDIDEYMKNALVESIPK